MAVQRKNSGELKKKRIFITGGTGFIASYITERLIDDNKIVLYDIQQRDALQYTPFKNHKNLEVIKGDVLDAEHLKQAAKGSDVLIHCAAIAGIYSVVKSPSLTLRVSFLGTYNALQAAVHHKIKKFVDFSTSEVYGPFVYKGTEDALTTQGSVGESRWSYSVGKLAAEHLTHSYHKEFGLAVSSVRPFNVYGPRQIGEGAIRGMILKAIKNEPITLYNDGTQIRAWCYVEDFVDGVMAILTNPASDGHCFNIGNPQGSITNYQLARMIKRLADSESDIVFKKHPGPEVEIRVPSIEKAQTLLDFTPKVNLETGISKTIEWYRTHTGE
jgi:nucleoside-diphosphate-sugar epimerase